MNNVSMFFLSGLNETKNYRSSLFFLSLMCYCIIILLNVSLVLIIILDNNMHEPMYVMLCAFCMNGLYGATGFFPKFLWDLLSPVHIISFSGCLVQAQVIHSFSCCDLSILAVMAYDRYLAICQPLQYHSVMLRQKVFKLVFFSLVTPSCITAVSMFVTSRLTLCSSTINKIYCKNWSIVSLACFPEEMTVSNLLAYFTLIVYIFHGFFIIWSYIYIIKTCANSIENRAKFMQTCVPHLFSLLLFSLTILFDFTNMRFPSKDLPQTLYNFIAIEFLIIPPLMNPLIYGFKLTKIRKKIRHLILMQTKGSGPFLGV